jgi:hypothetical protein
MEVEMKLEELGPEEGEDLIRELRAIRHDLGRYICFEQRFLERKDDVLELRQALQSDLLSTRRTADGSETCFALWARLRPAVLDDDPDIRVIDQAIADIMRVDLDGPLEELERAARLASRVRDASKRLFDRSMKFNKDRVDALAGGPSHG